jgi:hypothetical protein
MTTNEGSTMEPTPAELRARSEWHDPHQPDPSLDSLLRLLEAPDGVKPPREQTMDDVEWERA